MKRILVAALAVAICSVSFASAELPGPINYTPAPVAVPAPAYAPVYQPQYVPAPQPVVVQRQGFFSGVVGFTKNRVADVGDVICETFDAVTGIVTIDPAQDDIY